MGWLIFINTYIYEEYIIYVKIQTKSKTNMKLFYYMALFGIIMLLTATKAQLPNDDEENEIGSGEATKMTTEEAATEKVMTAKMTSEVATKLATEEETPAEETTEVVTSQEEESEATTTTKKAVEAATEKATTEAAAEVVTESSASTGTCSIISLCCLYLFVFAS